LEGNQIAADREVALLSFPTWAARGESGAPVCSVIPMKMGIQIQVVLFWIPAYAGMTEAFHHLRYFTAKILIITHFLIIFSAMKKRTSAL